jgi:5'-nucleotidase
VNALVPEVKELGASAIVVVVHQGDSPPPGSTYDACNDTTGPAYTMAMKMDPAVDAIVSAHTHRAYNCTLNGKLVTSAASYGRVITEMNLHIDTTDRRVVSKLAQQRLVTRDVTPDPTVNAVVNSYLALTRTSADVDDGYTAVDISSFADPLTGQSAVGDVIADGMLASVAGAAVALMNPGGVRDGIQFAKLYPTDSNTSDGVITFEKLKTVQPFANKLTAGLVSAADLKEILEEQWKGQAYAKILQLAGMTYHYSQAAAVGAKITKITLGGTDLDLTDTNRTIKVVTNEFISAGGDGFVQFKTITATSPFPATGAIDVDVTAAWTAGHSASTSQTALPVPSLQGRVFADP